MEGLVLGGRSAERRRGDVDGPSGVRRADARGRVRGDGLLAVGIRRRHPHPEPSIDIGRGDDVLRGRGAADRGAVGAVGPAAVLGAANPLVGEARRAAGPGAGRRRQRRADRRRPRDPGLGRVVRACLRGCAAAAREREDRRGRRERRYHDRPREKGGSCPAHFSVLSRDAENRTSPPRATIDHLLTEDSPGLRKIHLLLTPC